MPKSLLSVCLILAGLAMVALPAQASQRIVLGELFTSDG